MGHQAVSTGVQGYRVHESSQGSHHQVCPSSGKWKSPHSTSTHIPLTRLSHMVAPAWKVKTRERKQKSSHLESFGSLCHVSLDSVSFSSHCLICLSLLRTWLPPFLHLSLLQKAHLTSLGCCVSLIGLSLSVTCKSIQTSSSGKKRFYEVMYWIKERIYLQAWMDPEVPMMLPELSLSIS